MAARQHLPLGCCRNVCLLVAPPMAHLYIAALDEGRLRAAPLRAPSWFWHVACHRVAHGKLTISDAMAGAVCAPTPSPEGSDSQAGDVRVSDAFAADSPLLPSSGTHRSNRDGVAGGRFQRTGRSSALLRGIRVARMVATPWFGWLTIVNATVAQSPLSPTLLNGLLEACHKSTGRSARRLSGCLRGASIHGGGSHRSPTGMFAHVLGCKANVRVAQELCMGNVFAFELNHS